MKGEWRSPLTLSWLSWHGCDLSTLPRSCFDMPSTSTSARTQIHPESSAATVASGSSDRVKTLSGRSMSGRNSAHGSLRGAGGNLSMRVRTWARYCMGRLHADACMGVLLHGEVACGCVHERIAAWGGCMGGVAWEGLHGCMSPKPHTSARRAATARGANSACGRGCKGGRRGAGVRVGGGCGCKGGRRVRVQGWAEGAGVRVGGGDTSAPLVLHACMGRWVLHACPWPT